MSNNDPARAPDGPAPIQPPAKSGVPPRAPMPPLMAATPSPAASRPPAPPLMRRSVTAAGMPGAAQSVAGPSSGPPAISVRGLRQVFQRSAFQLYLPVLDILPGELTYIGGASGSGKSTLIKILALEVKPSMGDMWLMGHHVQTLPPLELDDLRGGGLTYIPQEHLGLTDSTAVQNIQRVLYDYDGLSLYDSERQAAAALSAVGLKSERFQQRVSLLSGGEKARVAIAKVFARGRPVCLADEILPALDNDSRLAVLHLLQGLAAEGYTVAVIAHQPELKPYFHRVLEMRDGQLIGD